MLTQTEIDPSFAASLRRRIRFFCLYLSARAHSKTLEKLVPIVEDAFTHPWVAGVELKIRFWPGNETWFGRLWRLYRSLPTSSMHWDAPVAVSVFRKRNGKKKLALCMSLYVVDRTLYVGQLQGVAGTDIPKELRAWPKLFVEACRTFARQEGLRSVKVPSAEALYSYHHPGLNPNMLPESRDNALQRIQRNMKLLYNSNALELGFVPDDSWLAWENLAAVFSAPGSLSSKILRRFSPQFRMGLVRRFVPIATSLAIAVVMTVAILLIKNGTLGRHLIFLYILPTIFVTFLYGSVPAIVLAFGAIACVAFFFYDPPYSLYVANPYDVMELVCFAVIALITTKSVTGLVRSTDAKNETSAIAHRGERGDFT